MTNNIKSVARTEEQVIARIKEWGWFTAMGPWDDKLCKDLVEKGVIKKWGTMHCTFVMKEDNRK